jgi:ribosomal protein S18 acetylase RimI-like enzyme
MVSSASAVEYKISAPVSDQELNELFSASWPNHHPVEFQAVLRQSMAYVCGYQKRRLVGYVNAAWDGRTHAFILDTTVHPGHRRLGIGKELVVRAIEQAKLRGVTWVHVDYEPRLKEFYAMCGFRPSEAGVLSVAGVA